MVENIVHVSGVDKSTNNHNCRYKMKSFRSVRVYVIKGSSASPHSYTITYKVFILTITQLYIKQTLGFHVHSVENMSYIVSMCQRMTGSKFVFQLLLFCEKLILYSIKFQHSAIDAFFELNCNRWFPFSI